MLFIFLVEGDNDSELEKVSILMKDELLNSMKEIEPQYKQVN